MSAKRSARRFGLGRGLIVSALTLALVVAALELLGVALDPGSRRRTQLRATLLQVSMSTEPISDQFACPWSDPAAIMVRMPEQPGDERVPRLFRGARVTADPGGVVQALLTHDDLQRSQKLVAVIGGSAAFGFPYRHRHSVAAQLQARLGRAQFRVINAAQPGWSSGQLVEVTRRLVSFKPHAVVIFLGNNEWFHWDPLLLSSNQSAAFKALALTRHSRFLSLAGHALLRRSARQNQGAQLKPQQRPSLQNMQFTASRWFETKRRFLSTLEANLTNMIRLARRGGAQVYVLTMPFNYRLSVDFKTTQPDSFSAIHAGAVQRALQVATAARRRRSYGLCVQGLDAALALDPHPPLLHHLRGSCLELAGRPAKAELAYAQAREQMVGNLGSVISVNNVIRRTAMTSGARLVDAKRLFDKYEHSRGRYFNQDLIHDECHPTPAGSGLIADVLATRLIKATGVRVGAVPNTQ